ncbi:hypothetical protein [Morganella morganii]|uniref:hypothetical protein n=1 Tax=Morganella morganii TaxID=582 RepID=UPI001896F43C|nr:hypothetical protein [Morganella morganii]
MSALASQIEGAYVVGGCGQSRGIMLASDAETSVCKANNTTLVHTGYNSLIYNDFPLTTASYSGQLSDYGPDWDTDGKFLPANSNVLITTGTGGSIITGVNDSDLPTRFFSLGDKSIMQLSDTYSFLDQNPAGTSDHIYRFPVKAVIDGYCSVMESGYGGDSRVIPSNSVLISLGEKNELNNAGVDSIVASFGDNSAIRCNSYATSEYIFAGGKNTVVKADEDDSVVFVAQKARSIDISGEAVLMAKETPEYFCVGENSAIAIGWHDGIRERIAVFYEGENGVKAGVKYTMDSNGQLIPL